MADPNLKVGPQDPDNTAELTQRFGVANNALHLLRRHARNMPAELAADIARPRDERRSVVAEENLDYIADRIGFPESVVVEGASVRGTSDVRSEDRVLLVLYRVASGRSAKASVEYEKFPKLERIYEQRERARLGLVARAAASDPDQADGDLPLTGEDAEELRRRLEEAEAKLEELEEGGGDAEPAEPFEGYSDAKVEDIKARIEEEPEGFERELLKRQVREYEEQQDRPRVGVIEATEPVELVPAAAE